MRTTTATDRDLARRVRDCYESERLACEAARRGKAAPRRAPTRRAGPDVGGPGCPWLGLARLCAGRSVDPLAYIAWSFDRAPPGNLPGPRQLLGRGPLEEFLAARGARRREIEVAFCIQREQARMRILLATSPGGRAAADAQAEVLLDEGIPLSALFRYCLARSIGGERFDRIAGLYEAAAARQYRRARVEYDAVWGEWIPRPLRESSL